MMKGQKHNRLADGFVIVDGSYGSMQSEEEYLRNELKDLKKQTIEVLVEMADVELRQIPRMQAAYAATVGRWEHKLVRSEMALCHARRVCARLERQHSAEKYARSQGNVFVRSVRPKAESVTMQTRKASGASSQGATRTTPAVGYVSAYMPLSVAVAKPERQTQSSRQRARVAAEMKIAEEFAAWRGRLAANERARNEAIRRATQTKTLNAEENRRLMHLFHVLTDRLHPSIIPFCSTEDENLYRRACVAFKKGDIETLRHLESQTRMRAGVVLEDGYIQRLDNAELRAEVAVRDARLSLLREQLTRMKKSHPYVSRDKAVDDAWMAQRVAEVRRRIERIDALRAGYEKRIRKLSVKLRRNSRKRAIA